MTPGFLGNLVSIAAALANFITTLIETGAGIMTQLLQSSMTGASPSAAAKKPAKKA